MTTATQTFAPPAEPWNQLFPTNKPYLIRNIIATQSPLTALVLAINIDTVGKISYASRVAHAVQKTSETVIVSRTTYLYELGVRNSAAKLSKGTLDILFLYHSPNGATILHLTPLPAAGGQPGQVSGDSSVAHGRSKTRSSHVPSAGLT